MESESHHTDYSCHCGYRSIKMYRFDYRIVS